MKKSGNIFRYRQSIRFRALIGIASVLLLTIRVASAFLHTHTSLETSAPEIIASAHCDACDYEATQAIEPDIAITLPIIQFHYQLQAFKIQSPFISELYSSSDYRGPPLVS